jgi:hypothetical protein
MAKNPKSTKRAKSAAKVAKSAKSAATAKAPVSRARFGPTECHAPGCDGQRYLKGSLLCRDHQAAWARGEFRLSQRGWDRLNASKSKAAKAPKRGTRGGTKSAPAPVATTDDELEDVLAASVARFATPALAKAAAAKRRSRRS